MNTQTKNRLVLGAVVALFAIPLIIAFALRNSGWHPDKTRNSGTLVEPPRDVTNVVATSSDGSRFAWKDAQFHWTLLMFPSADCATRCTERIDEAVRMRLTLGRNADRLRIAYIGTKQPDEFFTNRAPLNFLRDEASPFAAEAPRDSDSLALGLVDPNGLLILRYPDGYSAQGLRSDITRIIY